MSEIKRMCPRCDRKTLHDEWTESMCGGRENLAERIFEGFISMGFSELGKDGYRRCLRCGYTRKYK